MTQSARSKPTLFVPRCIVSGGQTGVDRAALEVAIALGIDHGGWCPRGRLAEDGTIPSRYNLQENESREYRVRTKQNVLDSDATLILYERRLQGGTLLTRQFAARAGMPYFLVRMDRDDTDGVRQWLSTDQPRRLNVAGPRESNSPGIFDRSMTYLLQIFS